jgi:predicted ArsR family transcriptional regulator
VVELLRRQAMTIDELADALGITRTAVRSHLTTLQHEGAVEQHGMRRGPSKPARTYRVTLEAELLLSRAYIPILTQLLHVLAGRMSGDQFDGIMREVGRRMMAGRAMPTGSISARVKAGSELLNELGGLTTVVAEPKHFVIQSHGCPLAAATAEHPEACNAMESLLSEFVGQRVEKCCERSDRERCCFEIERTRVSARPRSRR